MNKEQTWPFLFITVNWIHLKKFYLSRFDYCLEPILMKSSIIAEWDSVKEDNLKLGLSCD